MPCYVHNQYQAIGTCVGCGKFICSECTTEVEGKNHCKRCVAELLSKSSAVAPVHASPVARPYNWGYMLPYPSQNVGIHILLLLFTAGIGNLIYFFYVRNEQERWHLINSRRGMPNPYGAPNPYNPHYPHSAYHPHAAHYPPHHTQHNVHHPQGTPYPLDARRPQDTTQQQGSQQPQNTHFPQQTDNIH